MTTLTTEIVEKVAHLARLSIGSDEIAAHVRNLTNILGLVDQMNNVDTSQIAAMAHPLNIAQPMRSDTIEEENQRSALQGPGVVPASAIKSGLYIVPKAYDTSKE